MDREADKKDKIDWKWLISLPKFQREWELKRIANKKKEKVDDRMDSK